MFAIVRSGYRQIVVDPNIISVTLLQLGCFIRMSSCSLPLQPYPRGGDTTWLNLAHASKVVLVSWSCRTP
jgi:hypothetical protein